MGCYLYNKAKRCSRMREREEKKTYSVCLFAGRSPKSWAPPSLSHLPPIHFFLYHRIEISLCKSPNKQRATLRGTRQVVRVNVACTSATCFARHMEAKHQQHFGLHSLSPAHTAPPGQYLSNAKHFFLIARRGCHHHHTFTLFGCDSETFLFVCLKDANSCG